MCGVDVRQEECAAVCTGTVLAEHPVSLFSKKKIEIWRVADAPQVVSTHQALEACPKVAVPVVRPKLDGLVDRAVAVTEVSTLRGAEVEAKALDRAL
jgi:hypothetical protein